MKTTTIPKPRSRFLLVKCKNCGNEQVIFDHSSTVVKCNVCENDLVIPTGGKSKILGEILKVLS